MFLCGVAWAFYVVMAKPLIQKYGSLLRPGALDFDLHRAHGRRMVSAETFTTLATMTTRNWLDMFYMVDDLDRHRDHYLELRRIRLSAATTGATLYFVPVIGVIAGALMLGEGNRMNTLIGGALISPAWPLHNSAPCCCASAKSDASAAEGKLSPHTQAAINRMESSKREAKMFGLAAVIFAVTMWGSFPWPCVS